MHVYNLIDKLEVDDMLLIDFEKASTLLNSRSFKKTLQFYEFGPFFQRWIKRFHLDISSPQGRVVMNNYCQINIYYGTFLYITLGIFTKRKF
jgi:glucan biosynthesis protein